MNQHTTNVIPKTTRGRFRAFLHQKRGCRRKSLQRSLTLSILAVHLTVLALALSVNFVVLFHISEKQALEEGQRRLEYREYQMDNLLSNLKDIRALLMQDKAVQNYLDVPRTEGVEDIVRRVNVCNALSQVLKSYNYLDSVTLFQWPASKDGSNIGVSRMRVSQGSSDDPLLPVETAESFHGLTAASPLTWGGQFRSNDLLPNPVSFGGSQEMDASVLVTLPNIWRSDPLSVASINIPLQYFQFLYSPDRDRGSKVYLFDANRKLMMRVAEGDLEGRSVIVPDPGFGSRFLESSETTGSFDGQNEDTRTKVIYRRDVSSGWYLAEEIPYSVFLDSMLRLQWTVGLIFTGAILLVVLISYLVSRKLLNPFERIQRDMVDIGRGELSKRLPVMDYTELDPLIIHFNHMMEQIQTLMSKNQLYEEEKRTLEIEALQAQINPHFLYNSLTTIRWMASMARASNVCQALLALGNVLRPIFSQPGILWSLETERNFVENFVNIMDYRFGEKTQCVYHIPEELRKIPILRFLLQPAVENCISHGLRGKTDRVVEIGVRRVGELVSYFGKPLCKEDLEISITDNGYGMEPEALVKLNQLLEEDRREIQAEYGHGYGLYNVNRRIRLQYGDRYGLRAESAPGGGMAILIYISADPPGAEEVLG